MIPGGQEGGQPLCEPGVLQTEVVEEAEAEVGGAQGDALEGEAQHQANQDTDQGHQEHDKLFL